MTLSLPAPPLFKWKQAFKFQCHYFYQWSYTVAFQMFVMDGWMDGWKNRDWKCCVGIFIIQKRKPICVLKGATTQLCFSGGKYARVQVGVEFANFYISRVGFHFQIFSCILPPFFVRCVLENSLMDSTFPILCCCASVHNVEHLRGILSIRVLLEFGSEHSTF